MMSLNFVNQIYVSKWIRFSTPQKKYKTFVAAIFADYIRVGPTL